VFGPHLDAAVAYADLLATEGVRRGLIGPREVDRLWERHLLNCAVVEALIPSGAIVVDVGSGAGLPGIPLALARPDLAVLLVEPLERRVRFLRECVTALGLAVQVRRARAEELPGSVRGDAVVARAVGPLARLLPVTVPLAAPGGHVLAIKGQRAEEELAGARPMLRRLGVSSAHIHTVGADVVYPPTRVVVVVPGRGDRTLAASARRVRAAASRRRRP
jgi:16S rRNA (guanine527-N7)-methyltransferase